MRMRPGNLAEIERQFRERIDHLDYNGAWSIITPAIASADRIDDPATFQRILAAFAEVAEENYGASLGGPARAAARAPTSADQLYQLGYQLQEKALSTLSAGILRRAHALAPHHVPVLTELVSALEHHGRYREARALLEQAPPATRTHFMPMYLLAFNSVMAGNLDRARELLPALPTAPEGDKAFMVSRIERMLARADALQRELPAELGAPRGAHYVWYGSLLLCAPETCQPLQGHDSYGRINQTLVRLKLALDTWGLAPERILSLPDPASQSIANVVARFWTIPAEEWLGSAAPGLLVAYDLKQTIRELRERLRTKMPAQPLFAYLADARSEQEVCPDILGYRYLDHLPAWEAPRDSSEVDIFDTPAPVRPDPEQIGQRILEEASRPPDDSLLAMVKFMADIDLPDARPLARQESSRREPLWAQPQE